MKSFRSSLISEPCSIYSPNTASRTAFKFSSCALVAFFLAGVFLGSRALGRALGRIVSTAILPALTCSLTHSCSCWFDNPCGTGTGCFLFLAYV